MKKIKLMLCYAIAGLCVLSVFLPPKTLTVFNPGSHRDFEDDGLIFVLDEEMMIVPLTIAYRKSENDEENIHTLIQLMQQNLEVSGFETLLPQSLHFSRVSIQQQEVTLYVNEAFYAMNSAIELRVIEALVGVVVQFDSDYRVNFNVNGELATKMPLSQLPLTQLDETLGFNNFKGSAVDLHRTRSLQEVRLKEDGERSYYVIQSQRVSLALNDQEILEIMMRPYRSYLSQCSIEDDIAILHLTEKALLDETSVDLKVLQPFLFSLSLMQHVKKFQLRLHDEIVHVMGNQSSFNEINQFAINRFEL